MEDRPAQSICGSSCPVEIALDSFVELPAELLHSGLLELITDAMADLLGGSGLVRSLLPVCRSWFSAVVCHPSAYCWPLQAWGASACRQLDEHSGRMGEPPQHWVDDLGIALEHAETELRLTELSVAQPTGITVVLGRHAHWLGSLLIWLRLGIRVAAEDATDVAAVGVAAAALQCSGENVACCSVDAAQNAATAAAWSSLEDAAGSSGSAVWDEAAAAADQRRDHSRTEERAPGCSASVARDFAAAASDRARYRAREAEEFQRRLAILADVVLEISPRLPDPGLPARWADWFEDHGEQAGLHKSHCLRYMEQREQVARVWAQNQITLQKTAEYVEALTECCASELGIAYTLPASHSSCASGRMVIVH